MNAQAKEAFRFLVSVVNVQAFDEGSMASAPWFLPWDPLEDLMPFFSYRTVRAYIIETVSILRFDFKGNISSDFPEACDKISKLYAREFCKDLNCTLKLVANRLAVRCHESVPVPDCIYCPPHRWQNVVGYVDFESFEKREYSMTHTFFRSHNHTDGGDRGETFTVSFEFVLPLVYISDLPNDSTTAAVEALMPKNGSTVVRVEDRSRPSWRHLAVEFESFAALDDTVKTHQRKPFVLGGVSQGMSTEELPSPVSLWLHCGGVMRCVTPLNPSVYGSQMRI